MKQLWTEFTRLIIKEEPKHHSRKTDQAVPAHSEPPTGHQDALSQLRHLITDYESLSLYKAMDLAG